MDGMRVAYHPLSTGGRGEMIISNTLQLERPTGVIAQISLAMFATFGDDPVAFAAFDACTTDGSNPPLPANEFLAQGTLSGAPKAVIIRSGLTSISYQIEIHNCSADFIINLFFWPGVVRGNL